MKFIKLTRYDGEIYPVYVNPYCIQYLNGSWLEFGNNRILVKESPEEILKLIKESEQ
jgi:hypothetical protein